MDTTPSSAPAPRPEFPEGFREVTSSRIQALAYFEANTQRDVTGDPAALNREHKDGRLEVIFKGNARYSYENVLPYQMEALLDDVTRRDTFNEIVKNPELYPFSRMADFVPTVEV